MPKETSSAASATARRSSRAAAGVLLAAAALFAHGGNAWAEPPAPSAWSNEPIKPLPALPVLDARKVALGQQLFEDRRLSSNNAQACISCHDIHTNGATGKTKDVGPFGQPMLRNTPTIFNSALNFRQFWDGHLATQHAAISEVVQNPVVMRSTWHEVLGKLRSDHVVVDKFTAIYPDGVQQNNVMDAMATFMKTLQTPNARIDRYLAGENSALTPDERLGYQLFKSYGCVACHQGANIGGNMFQVMGVLGNRGLYFTKDGALVTDLGRYAVTKQEADKFVFRVPSLRNVAVTPPYFHDGSASTLPEAVHAMFEYQLGRKPSPQDLELIVKFLGALTGEYQGHPLKAPESR